MIDLEQLYEGFVRSYASLLLPAKEEVNSPQETHALTDYFRRLGIALGYSVLCEKTYKGRPHDLDWVLGEGDTPIAHFEFENQAAKLLDTLKKLKASKFPFRIGYQWVPKSKAAPLERRLNRFKADPGMSGSQALFIARLYPLAKDEKPDCERCETFTYPVEAFLVRNGKVRRLRPAKLIWPHVGFLSMQFDGEANWK